MAAESRERGKGADPVFARDRSLGIAVEPFQMIKPRQAINCSPFKRADRGEPVRAGRLMLEAQCFGATSQAGQGGRRQSLVAQFEGKASPGGDCRIEAGVLPYAIECANEGRVLGCNRGVADGGGKGIAPVSDAKVDGNRI